MPNNYVSEELNNGFYQDNNVYEEIGELHANSKNAVVGRIDSRYDETKKKSLIYPDSDRLIYNYSSDSRVSDIAIRKAQDSLTEKILFVGKDFISIYDSDGGNFVLKEPKELLSDLRNPYTSTINAGFAGLNGNEVDPDNIELLDYNSLDFICKNIKYCLQLDKSFLIFVELNDGHTVPFKLDPDNLSISKFSPKSFYDTFDSSKKIVSKPVIINNILYILSVNSDDNTVDLYNCNINEPNVALVRDNTALSSLGTANFGSIGCTFEYINNLPVMKVFNIANGELKCVAITITDTTYTYKELLVNEKSDNNSYATDYDTEIKEIRVVGAISNVHILLLLSNGVLKIINDGYISNEINVYTRRNINQIKYFIHNINNEMNNKNVLRFYDSYGRSNLACKVFENNTENTLNPLFTTSKYSFDIDAFVNEDNLFTNYNGNAEVVGYILHNNTTILYGYYNENGLIKPLIKCFTPDKEAYIVESTTLTDKENKKPFDNGLEPDSGVDIVKNINFGDSKITKVEIKPIINNDVSDDKIVNLSDKDYATGETIWRALHKSGIPFNTQIKTFGRIIIDGYNIPIESVLITRPDTEDPDDYGSVLLSFDKMFDINSLDKNYLKLGNVLYPGILFRHNDGFLNDAMISNVFNVDSTFSYDDASNGNLFEDDLSLTIKHSEIVTIGSTMIMIVAASGGRIASINLNTGDFTTPNGTDYGENAPGISSSIIPYNWAKDGEILTIVKRDRSVGGSRSLFILYTSGKIVRYDIENAYAEEVPSPYVSDLDCGTERTVTVFNVKDNVISYFVNDNTRKIVKFDIDKGSYTEKSNFTMNETIKSNIITIGNSFYFLNNNSLVKTNVLSEETTALINTGIIYEKGCICYDYNDRIYILLNGSVYYYEISSGEIKRLITDIFVDSFIAYYNDRLWGVKYIDEEYILCSVDVNDKALTVRIEERIDELENDERIDWSSDLINYNFYYKTDSLTIACNTKSAISLIEITTDDLTLVSRPEVGSVRHNNYTTNLHNNKLFYDGTKFIYLDDSSDAQLSDEQIKSVNIDNLDSLIDYNTTNTILGFVNNVLYFIKNDKVFAKDLRKTHYNTINEVKSSVIDLSQIHEDLMVTAIGYADNGNLLIIAYEDGSIESIYSPEYNEANGYYNSNSGDITEQYSRTLFVEKNITEDTLLSSVPKHSMTGYSFLGWSLDNTEENMIPVENTNEMNSTNLVAGTKIYAVMKDNIEEYSDRCATRMYAKASEISDTPIVSIEELDDDVYLKTTSRSIRWASDIGVFFEGNDEYFTGQNTSYKNKGIYNHKLKSELYINGAGSVNVGKYIFYINGYNPSAVNPQTTVHNGIVVYDSQYNEYSVLSKGTDNLHGSILSRIFPYCYYHNGYIYIFGGLTRRDIHVDDNVNANNTNYSKFSRTNKIERYDLRTGEYCILEAKYGPDDVYEGTKLKYCGLDEIRYLYNFNNGHYLEGKSYISELGKSVAYEFDLDTETMVLRIDDDSDVSSDWRYSVLTEIPCEDEDTTLSLVLARHYSENNLDNEILYLAQEPDDPDERRFKISEGINVSNISVNVSECINSIIILQILDTDTNNIKTLKLKYDGDTFETLETSISDKSTKNNLYFSNVIYNKNKVSRVFNIGNNEYLIDNTYKPIKTKSNDYLYAYDKSIFKNFYDRIIEVDENIPLSENVTVKDKVLFINNVEYIVHYTNTKITVKKVDTDLNEISVSKTISSSSNAVANIAVIYQEKDDTITIIAVNSNNEIIKILSYMVDKNSLIERSGDYTDNGIDIDTLTYSEEYNCIYSFYNNDIEKISGIDVRSIDNNEPIRISAFSASYNTWRGLDILENNTANVYYIIAENTTLLIENRNISDTGDIGSVNNSISIKMPGVSNNSIKSIKIIDDKLVAFMDTSDVNKTGDIKFIDDSYNSDDITIPSGSKIYDISRDSIKYILGNKCYSVNRLFKNNQNDDIIHINQQVSKTDNAYICDNDEYIFVVNNISNSKEKSISKINKSDNSVETLIVGFNYQDNIPDNSKIVGIFADNEKLYLIDSTNQCIHELNISNYHYKKHECSNIGDNSNVKTSTSGDKIYVLIDSNLYEVINGSLIYITSNVPIDNVLDIRYIKEYGSVYFVSCPESISNIKISSYNLVTNELKEVSISEVNRVENKSEDFANVGNNQYLPIINLDEHGNLFVLGGTLNKIDFNPNHSTIYDGSNYRDYIEINKPNSNEIALRNVIDKNRYYTLNIDVSNEIDVVISTRQENEYRGSLIDIGENISLSKEKTFMFNGDLYGFNLNETDHISKYNKTTKKFDIYSNEPIPHTGNIFVSSHCYSDSTVYLVFISFSMRSIIANVVGYNLNTKKVVSNVTENVYDAVSNITTLSAPMNNSWRGKYFITNINTLENSVLLVLNVLKLKNIKVLAKSVIGVTKNDTVYFKDNLYRFGLGRQYIIKRLIGNDDDSEIVSSDLVGVGTNTVCSGNRLLLQGSEPIEISLSAKKFMKSDTRFINGSSNITRIFPINDNKIAMINPNNLSSDDIENRPRVFEFKKSPIKFMKISDNIGLKIYSGATRDIVILYNTTNNDIFDKLNVDHELGSSISDITKYTDDNYIINHSDTPRISTLKINSNNKLSLKRYDGKLFGEMIDTGTNLHTVQDVDLTMIFDKCMDEYDIRKQTSE